MRTWAASHPSRNGSAPTVWSVTAYRMVVLAYILAVSIPPIGFTMGVVIAIRFEKPASRQAVWIIALSIVAAIAWVAIIAGGALNFSDTDF